MDKVFFSEKQVERANYFSNQLGNLNNSITKGEGNFAGILGEIAISDLIGGNLISIRNGEDKFDYDILWKNLKIEVKSKRRNVPPKPWYLAHVAELSKHQQPDLYCFTSITFKKNSKKPIDIWLCGFIKASDFFEKARFWKKGEIEKPTNFAMKCNCYTLEYNQLKSLPEIINE